MVELRTIRPEILWGSFVKDPFIFDLCVASPRHGRIFADPASGV